MAKVFRRLFAKHITDPLLQQAALSQEMARVRAEIRRDMPDNLLLKGYKIYSQTDEDGIIAAIFDRIGGGRTFIEIGSGNGTENNTHALLLCGWRGVWVDGRADRIAFVRSEVGSTPDLLAEQAFVTRENVPTLAADWLRRLGTQAIDFFSLDIDGNDLHVLLAALGVFRPRVICVEYNAKFPPPLELAIEYDPKHVWSGDDYHGVSLAALVSALRPLGYTLVTCNIAGVNAFFVADAVAGAFTLYEPARLFQPSRFHLCSFESGHTPSLKFLRHALARRRT
ncbi:MAG: hypothetical protein U1E63_08520 [Burkholderiales bacterium]